MRVLKAARLIDGTGRPPIDQGIVHVAGTTIRFAGRAADAPPAEPGSEVIDLGEMTLLPGMIDCHAHPMLPFHPRNQSEVYEWSDELKLVHALGSLRAALHSGITTMRDCGAPGTTAFTLRSGIQKGLADGPRLIVAGRIICSTGGHSYPFSTEADGRTGVRREARRLFKEGADFIKIIATGGGTPGTLRHRASFTVEEIRAAVEEAEVHDTYATAHCHAIEGMERAMDAGIHMIEHGTFVRLDGLEQFDADLAKRIRDQNVVVVPTPQVLGRWVEEGATRLGDMSPDERARWNTQSESFRRRQDIVAQLHQSGVTLLTGSDSSWRVGPIDDLAFGLELFVRAGIPPIRAIHAATGLAAERLGIGKITGTLEAGKEADLLAVEGNPAEDIKAMARPHLVIKGGHVHRLEDPAFEGLVQA